MIVRADLPRGLQAAQVIHAAGESSPGQLAPGTHAICLVVPDENALRALANRMTSAAIAFVGIVETDAPHTGELTAIGCMPARKEVLRRLLSSIPLLK